MEKMQGYEEAQAITGEYETLKAGGYICKIISAKEEMSKTGKKMLVLALDIAEGDKKDFFKNRFEENKNENKKWSSNAIYRQMLEGEKAVSYLKGLMTSLEESNSNFKWNWKEEELKGLLCGAIFADEEYEKMDGTVGVATKVKYIRTTESIKSGNYKVPPVKKLPQKEEMFVPYEDDLPF